MIQKSPLNWYGLCSHTIDNGFSISLAAFWSAKPLFVVQVDLALEEIVRLQEEGPSQEDISAILEIEQRAHENGLQVCLFLRTVHNHESITAKNHILLRKQNELYFLFRKTITG